MMRREVPQKGGYQGLFLSVKDRVTFAHECCLKRAIKAKQNDYPAYICFNFLFHHTYHWELKSVILSITLSLIHSMSIYHLTMLGSPIDLDEDLQDHFSPFSQEGLPFHLADTSRNIESKLLNSQGSMSLKQYFLQSTGGYKHLNQSHLKQ